MTVTAYKYRCGNCIGSNECAGCFTNDPESKGAQQLPCLLKDEDSFWDGLSKPDFKIINKAVSNE